jgi:hypothetical protein
MPHKFNPFHHIYCIYLLERLVSCLIMTVQPLSYLILPYNTDADPSVDWMLRHGRSVALSVALKQAPNKLLADEFNSRTIEAVTAFSNADRVSHDNRNLVLNTV